MKRFAYGIAHANGYDGNFLHWSAYVFPLDVPENTPLPTPDASTCGHAHKTPRAARACGVRLVRTRTQEAY